MGTEEFLDTNVFGNTFTRENPGVSTGLWVAKRANKNSIFYKICNYGMSKCLQKNPEKDNYEVIVDTEIKGETKNKKSQEWSLNDGRLLNRETKLYLTVNTDSQVYLTGKLEESDIIEASQQWNFVPYKTPEDEGR